MRVGHGACREPARLEHDDLAAAQPRFFEQRNRNDGALAGAGRRFHHGIAVRRAVRRAAQAGLRRWAGRISRGADHTRAPSASIRRMRWRQSTEQARTSEDYRGRSARRWRRRHEVRACGTSWLIGASPISSASIRGSSWACSAAAGPRPRTEAPVDPGTPADESRPVRRSMCSATPKKPGPRSSPRRGQQYVDARPRAVQRRHQHWLRLGHVGGRAVLLPAPTDKVYIDLAFFRAARNRVRRAG